MITPSKKFYNSQTNTWELLYATEGLSAYETAKLNGYTGTEEEFNTTLSEISDLTRVVHNQHSNIKLKSNKSIFETGVSNEIILTWDILYNDESCTPTSLILKRDSTILSRDITNTFTDVITSTSIYTIEVEVYPEVFKKDQLIVPSYYPIYIGSSIKSSILQQDILGFIKQPIRDSAKGNITVNIGSNEYLWVCLPSSMGFTKITSSGFEVPMEEKIVINVVNKTSYNCYRSSSTFKAGVFNGNII